MHIVSLKSLLAAAIAAVVLIVMLMGAATGPVAPQAPATAAATQSAEKSETILQNGNMPVTLQLSVSIVAKSPGAAVKSLFPSGVDSIKFPNVPPATPPYDALSLNLGLQTEDGETVSLGRKVIQVAKRGGETGVQIVKTSLDHGELVVVFGLKYLGMGDRIGVWHVLMRSYDDSKLMYAQLMTDELTFLDTVWTMNQSGGPPITDKTLGVQLARGDAGRWFIELTDLRPAMAKLTLDPAVFVQDPERWNFVLTRYLGGGHPRAVK
jgi:hypothetical protein